MGEFVIIIKHINKSHKINEKTHTHTYIYIYNNENGLPDAPMD
jgi:hypothetical protein